jgi:hypothetical protein
MKAESRTRCKGVPLVASCDPFEPWLIERQPRAIPLLYFESELLSLEPGGMAFDSTRQPYSGATRSLVLAFDVGTTFSGVSYAILEPGEVPKIHGVTRSEKTLYAPPRFLPETPLDFQARSM